MNVQCVSQDWEFHPFIYANFHQLVLLELAYPQGLINIYAMNTFSGLRQFIVVRPFCNVF